MARPVGSPGVRRNRGTNDSVDVDQAHPDRSTRPIGVSARKHRLEEFKILASNRYRRAGYSREETAKRVAEDFSNELVTNREFLKWWDRFEPRSRAAPGRDVNRLVEVAAGLRLPERAWLRKYLETHEGSGRTARGAPPAGLPEWLWDFHVDVDVVALLPGRNQLVGAVQELREGCHLRVEPRLAER